MARSHKLCTSHSSAICEFEPVSFYLFYFVFSFFRPGRNVSFLLRFCCHLPFLWLFYLSLLVFWPLSCKSCAAKVASCETLLAFHHLTHTFGKHFTFSGDFISRSLITVCWLPFPCSFGKSMLRACLYRYVCGICMLIKGILKAHHCFCLLLQFIPSRLHPNYILWPEWQIVRQILMGIQMDICKCVCVCACHANLPF